jgi:predicted TPR repeat methyltransferase
VTEADASNWRAHWLLGVALHQDGHPFEAIDRLERATASAPDEPAPWLDGANACRAAGRNEDAVMMYRRGLALDASVAAAHNNLGNALRDLGRTAEAVAAYDRAAALADDPFPAASNRAHVVAKLADATGAQRLAAFDRAIELAGVLGHRGRDLANCHNARGNLHATGGEDAAAVADYERAVAEDPDFVEGHVNLGRARARQADYEGALSAFRRAVQLAPDDIAGYKRLGVLLRRMRRVDEAAAVYRAWHELDPDEPVARHMATSLAGDAAPARADDAYIEREFDDFAEQFDEVVAVLGYEAPAAMLRALEASHLGSRRDLDVADLGCGTGLCGPLLRDRARALVGVDLSAGMLEVAARRDTYDALVRDEITAYTRAHPRAFDLVVATDVFIYVGDLAPLLRAIANGLRPGGLLLATIEAGTTRGYALNAGGRFVHHRDDVAALVADAGLHATVSPTILRTELGADVHGFMIAARKPAV